VGVVARKDKMAKDDLFWIGVIGLGLGAVLLAKKVSPAECTNGDTKTDTCPDGTTYVRWDCGNGKWIERQYTVDPCGAPTCVSGQVQEITCSDGSKIIVANCVNGVWVSTGKSQADCPAPTKCSAQILSYLVS